LRALHDFRTFGQDATAPDAAENEPVRVDTADPPVVDPMGGSRIRVTGAGFDERTTATIGGERAVVERVETGTLVVRTPAVAGPRTALVVRRGAAVSAPVELEVFTPSDLPGARVFDASKGVETQGPAWHDEWQRLSVEIAPDWRVRDGNTTTWFPRTRRFYMVGGWNGYPVPDGFSSVPEGTYPPENTTNEVWSSPDGIAWTLELPHGHAQFERRHVHNTVVFRDRMWVIGGDTHQGHYNHDVVSSADGHTWVVELGPGAAAAPPWSPRGMQISGVFDGHLWTMGGQDMAGDPTEMQVYNDVWRSDDGVDWVQVAPHDSEAPDRWRGCAGVGGVVEFKRRLWLVGCGCDTSGSNCGPAELRAEVWSTVDGATWVRHRSPPWAGKTWHDVVVWDGRLWVLFGYTFGDPAAGWPQGNANEAWWSEDGEHWTPMPHDAPVPGSHAQGVAVGEEGVLLSGGNYTFGFGAGVDKSVWRLVSHHGDAVAGWTDRGEAGLHVAPPDEAARPVRLPDAFGPGSPGLHFDGSRTVLHLGDLQAPDPQPDGRTVLWVARAPELPTPWGWEETYAPVGTIVAGGLPGAGPDAAVGLSDGAVVLVHRTQALGSAGEPLYRRVEGGTGLQVGPGQVHLAGLTRSAEGVLHVVVDGRGLPAGLAESHSGGWNRLGGAMDDAYYGPHTRFAGTLGAVIILPFAAEAADLARIRAWSRGRFGSP
jgi:hypothetical protein